MCVDVDRHIQAHTTSWRYLRWEGGASENKGGGARIGVGRLEGTGKEAEAQRGGVHVSLFPHVTKITAD